MGNLDVESDTDSEIYRAGRARNISPTRAGDQPFPSNRPPSTRNIGPSVKIASKSRIYMNQEQQINQADKGR